MATLKNKKGIDVSTFQKTIDWSKAKSCVDFAIIRGGFGRGTVDDQAINNIKGCTAQKIPFGLYWFSYALSVNDCVKEADYACDMADKYHITLPVIAYDWEEDSEEYAAEHDVTMTNSLRLKFAVAFCERVKVRGYIPLLYINWSDYEDVGFDKLAESYYVWFSNPGGSKPNVKNLAFWQYSYTGNVPGIAYEGQNINVDMDMCYVDFPTITPVPAPTPTPEAKPPAGQPTSCSLKFAYLGNGWSCNVADQVKAVQLLLKGLGHKGMDGRALDIDGVFGVNTEYAVTAFQKAKKVAADGVVGPVTWKLLLGAK